MIVSKIFVLKIPMCSFFPWERVQRTPPIFKDVQDPETFRTISARWRHGSAINKAWKKEIHLNPCVQLLPKPQAHRSPTALLKQQGLRPLKPAVRWASCGLPMRYHSPETLGGLLVLGCSVSPGKPSDTYWGKERQLLALLVCTPVGDN